MSGSMTSRRPSSRAHRRRLAAWGDPGFVDSALTTWAGLVAVPEPVTRTVEEVTGVPARTFRRWAADHISDFRPLSHTPPPALRHYTN